MIIASSRIKACAGNCEKMKGMNSCRRAGLLHPFQTKRSTRLHSRLLQTNTTLAYFSGEKRALSDMNEQKAQQQAQRCSAVGSKFHSQLVCRVGRERANTTHTTTKATAARYSGPERNTHGLLIGPVDKQVIPSRRTQQKLVRSKVRPPPAREYKQHDRDQPTPPTS